MVSWRHVLWARAVQWVLRKLHIFGTPEEDAYYAWADERLDELAEQTKRKGE